jgi:major membrane immunogen (membrane-anchored lipoprotein)
MKQLVRATMPVLAIIFLAACGGNNSEKGSETQEPAHAAHDSTNMQESSAPVASVQLKDDKLNAVYQHYVHLTTALTNGDAAEAKIAGNAIEVGAKEVTGGGTLATTAAKITTASDIEAQRTAYATLSNEFISLVKKSGLNSGALYVDYCPMAMNDKGAYWLSANKEIKNPYFGEKMMTCGEIKDTVK